MPPLWCKVASDLDSHPKIRKAGRFGREVFLFALRRNAGPGNKVPGEIPKEDLDPDYLADQLMMSRDEAVTGVTAAVTASLLEEREDCYAIVPWKDGWGRGNGNGAHRQRMYRERLKNGNGDASDKTRDGGDKALRNGDEDKKKKEKKTSSQVDIDLTKRLFDWIVKNNPRHKFSTFTAAQQADHLNTWADHVRKMREIDKRTPEEIRQMIDKCQADSFWNGNIQSTETLRRQFDQLTIKFGLAKTKPAARNDQPRLVFKIGDSDVEVER